MRTAFVFEFPARVAESSEVAVSKRHLPSQGDNMAAQEHPYRVA